MQEDLEYHLYCNDDYEDAMRGQDFSFEGGYEDKNEYRNGNTHCNNKRRAADGTKFRCKNTYLNIVTGLCISCTISKRKR